MLASELIERYESIAAATRQMVEVAHAGDWDAVVRVQSRCADMVNSLRGLSEPPLTQDQQRRKISIIGQLLADDAEVRRLIEPRLAELERLLAGSRLRRRLGKAYGDGSASPAPA